MTSLIDSLNDGFIDEVNDRPPGKKKVDANKTNYIYRYKKVEYTTTIISLGVSFVIQIKSFWSMSRLNSDFSGNSFTLHLIASEMSLSHFQGLHFSSFTIPKESCVSAAVLHSWSPITMRHFYRDTGSRLYVHYTRSLFKTDQSSTAMESTDQGQRKTKGTVGGKTLK